MRWGYHDGTNGYLQINTLMNTGNNRYLTLFNDAQSSPYVDVYVNFKNIDGYRPANYKTGYVFALVDSRDMS